MADLKFLRRRPTRRGAPLHQIEVSGHKETTDILVIAGRTGEGYLYKYWNPEGVGPRWNARGDAYATKDRNLHISMNGPLRLTWSEWDQLVADMIELRALVEGSSSHA